MALGTIMHTTPPSLPTRIAPAPTVVAAAATVTVRDFLTNRHGFTLPASHASIVSYEAARAHASRSLFRNPGAFEVHFHGALERACDSPDEWIEKEAWEGGACWKVARRGNREDGVGPRVTVWAHFVRRSGVDLFGRSVAPGLPASAGRLRRRSDVGTEKHRRGAGGKRKRAAAAAWEGYSLPLPNASPWVYFSRYTEIVARLVPDVNVGEVGPFLSLCYPFPFPYHHSLSKPQH
jgi:hypothetical protein